MLCCRMVEGLTSELPWWVGIAPLLWLPLFASGSYAFVRIGLLGPARQVAAARSAHWSERARHLHTLRAAGVLLVLFVVFVSVFVAGRLAGPFNRLPAGLLMLGAAVASGIAGVWGYEDARRKPRRDVGDRVRTLVVHSFPLLTLLYAIATAALMPREPGVVVLALWSAGAVFLYTPASGWVLRRLGVFAEPPARLVRVFERASAHTGVQARGCFLIRTSHANAFALPIGRRIGVTRGALDELDDEELEAILRHELGHLGEDRVVVALRIAGTAAWLPIAFISPVGARFGLLAVAGLVIAVVVVYVGFLALSRRLEHAADQHAVDGASDEASAAYARALLALHRRGELPAVTGASTHPSLYDRLDAIGVKPDFERPAPPRSAERHPSMALALVLLLLAGVGGAITTSALRASAHTFEGYLAVVALDGGDRDDFRALFRLAREPEERALFVCAWASTSTESRAAYDAASVYAAAGDCEAAARWLQEGFDRHDGQPDPALYAAVVQCPDAVE